MVASAVTEVCLGKYCSNSCKNKVVVLNSFIQDIDVEFGETKITRIFKSKIKT